MAGNRAEIRSHIRSISKTRKITDAMQLISGVMLTREREHLRRVGTYADELRRVVRDALAGVEDIEHPYLRPPGVDAGRSGGVGQPLEFRRGELNKAPLTEHEGLADATGATSTDETRDRHYVLYIGSDLGMCGSYNANLTRVLEAQVERDAELHVLGTNQYRIIEEAGFTIANEPTTSADLEPETLRAMADDALARFASGELDQVDVLFTRFVNAVTFEPELMHLLPLADDPAEAGAGAAGNVVSDQSGAAGSVGSDASGTTASPTPPSHVYLEPDPVALIERLVKMMVESSVDMAFAQARTSEQASRQTAMKSATDNADELLDKLTLQFNQARQTAITQEITEIVSGADAK